MVREERKGRWRGKRGSEDGEGREEGKMEREERKRRLRGKRGGKDGEGKGEKKVDYVGVIKVDYDSSSGTGEEERRWREERAGD